MTSSTWLKYSLLASAALLPLGFSTGAAAQSQAPAQDQATQIQEVVVTASRRAEALNKVPISVAAFTKQRLDQQGVRSIDDVSRLTPGVTFSRGDARNAGASNIAIRGIASTVASSTTGIYIREAEGVREGFGDVFPSLPEGLCTGRFVLRNVPNAATYRKHGGGAESRRALL